MATTYPNVVFLGPPPKVGAGSMTQPKRLDVLLFDPRTLEVQIKRQGVPLRFQMGEDVSKTVYSWQPECEVLDPDQLALRIARHYKLDVVPLPTCEDGLVRWQFIAPR